MKGRPLWTAAEAEAATAGRSSADWSARGVSIDSRTLEPDDLFVALKGPKFDGHDFLAGVFEADAAAAMVHREDADLPADLPPGAPILWTYLVVNNGNVDLDNISLTDDQLGPITCPKTELVAGESMACTANGHAADLTNTTFTTVNGINGINTIPGTGAFQRIPPYDYGFSSFHPGGTHFQMADGSVQFLSEFIDAAVLTALTTRAGGEPISATDL